MATTTHIYLGNGPTGSRLVKVTVASQAITHVAKSAFSAKVASQDDLVEALSNGVKVETNGVTIEIAQEEPATASAK